MTWYENLQSALSQIDIDYEQVFYNSAKDLMNNYILVVCDNGQTAYEFTEIEYYFFDNSRHLDPYTHQNRLQLQANQFYVHRAWGNRGGIDLTFGNGIYCGGILIRGVYKMQYICGPVVCRNEIQNDIDPLIDSYCILQQKIECVIKERKVKNTDYKLYRSARFGIKQSVCDPSGDYLKRQYRFVRNDLYDATNNRIKGVLKDKSKLKFIGQLG